MVFLQQSSHSENADGGGLGIDTEVVGGWTRSVA